MLENSWLVVLWRIWETRNKENFLKHPINIQMIKASIDKQMQEINRNFSTRLIFLFFFPCCSAIAIKTIEKDHKNLFSHETSSKFEFFEGEQRHRRRLEEYQ